LCALAAPAPFLPGSDGLPVRRHAANARGSLALHIGGVSRNEDALRHACSRRRRPTHAGPGALKVAIFCQWALRRRLCRKGGQITAIQTKLTCCRVPNFSNRKGNCPGTPIANAIEREGTYRLNPIFNLLRADVMRIIPDNIGRLPVSAP
jgi:hypothetical protein